MVLPYYRRQCVLKQNMRLNIGKGLNGFERKNKIKLAIGKQLHQLIHLLIYDIYLYLRIHFDKRNHGFGENGAERMCDPNIERARQQFP